MPRRSPKQIAEEKRFAKQKTKELIEKAEQTFSKNKSLANRYITLARKLSMKYNLRIPSELKRRFCKHCYKFLMPGVNARVRTKDGKLIYTCFECKKFFRLPLKKIQK